MVESPELLMGLTWLAPGTFYPQHAHDAAEVYQMLLGCGEWGQTAGSLAPQRPGTFRDHPSSTPHTIKAPADAPMLAWCKTISARYLSRIVRAALFCLEGHAVLTRKCRRPLDAWTGDLRGGKFWFCDCDAGDALLSTIRAVREPERFYDALAPNYTTVMRGARVPSQFDTFVCRAWLQCRCSNSWPALLAFGTMP